MAGLLTVKDVMTKDTKVVRRDTSMQEVIATMTKFDISSVVVVEKDRPIGLITHKDVLTRLLELNFLPSALTAREVMSSPIVTIRQEASVDEAARLMASKRIKKLPVVQDDKLVGILTSMDIIREQPRLINLLEDLLRGCAPPK